MELTRGQMRSLLKLLDRAEDDCINGINEFSGQIAEDLKNDPQLKAIKRWRKLIEKQTSKEESDNAPSTSSLGDAADPGRVGARHNAASVRPHGCDL